MRNGPAPNILLFIVDSLSGNKFSGALKCGLIPNLARLCDENVIRVENCFTSLPSASITTHVSLLSGSLPIRHHIPGLRWYDSATGQQVSYFSPRAARINGDVNPELRSIYDIWPGPAACIAEPFSRNVQYSSFLIPNVVGDAAAVLLTHRLVQSNRYRLIVTWLNALDVLTHRFGPDSERYDVELRRLDRHLGLLLDYLHATGRDGNWVVVVSSDHGSIAVSRHVDLEATIRSAKLTKRSTVDARGSDSPRKGLPVKVVVQGDRCAHIHLPVSCSEDESVLCQLIKHLLRQRGVEIAVARLSPHRVLVASSRGRAIVGIKRLGNSPTRDWLYSYHIETAHDPLPYSSEPDVSSLTDGSDYTAEEWLQATFRSRFPDLIPQVALLLQTARAGDVIAFAARGWDLRRGWRLGWNLGFHRGSHGSIEREEVSTPLIIRVPGCSSRHIEYCRSIDLLPTLMGLANSTQYELERMDGVDLMNVARTGSARNA